MDIAGHQFVTGPRACWPSGKDKDMRMRRDGSMGRSRAEQHMQKVSRCLGIFMIPPCQGCEESHVQPGHLLLSSLLGVEDQLMAI